TPASNSALLLNLEGVATLAIAWVVFRENVDNRLLFGAVAILAGAFLLSWSGQGVSFDKGAMFVVAACIAWGIDNNLTRKISAADPVLIAMLKGMVAGGINFTLACLYGIALPPVSIVLAAAIAGFFGVGVSLVLFILALRHLGTARTGAYFALAPFIGAILAVSLLADPVTPQLVIAALFMGLGLWFHLKERHEHEHHHEVLEHEHRHSHDEHHQHSHDFPVSEPHTHWHRHESMVHKHPHYPDLHHRHGH
ncbi:MAG: DMT family transporter, partial [Parvibaculaceae bacterium]